MRPELEQAPIVLQAHDGLRGIGKGAAQPRAEDFHGGAPHGRRARCRHSVKQATAQTEPWLLAASPNLAELDARAVVSLYAGRMQIEQSFGNVKNPRVGLGLSLSQTIRPDRLAILLMIGALAMFALWLIGLIAQARGYRVTFGSRANAASALSIISPARWWLDEPSHRTTRFQNKKNSSRWKYCVIWLGNGKYGGKGQIRHRFECFVFLNITLPVRNNLRALSRFDNQYCNRGGV